MKSVLLAGVAALLLSQNAGPGRAQGGDSAGNVRSVTLTVRGPDGLPLRRHALRVFTADPGPPGSQVGIGATDDRGRFVLTLPVGLRRLRVLAPGVGFGTTGIVVVGPGQAVSAALPPLARFARLSGTLAPAFRLPGVTVRLQDNFGDSSQNRPPVAVDAQGRFHLTDLTPGQVSLTVDGSSGQLPGSYFSFQLAPGESRTGIVLAPPATLPPPYHYETASGTRQVTLRGKVMDDHGNPVAGATVYTQTPDPQDSLRSASQSLFGSRPIALTAATGADGGYVLAAVTISRDAVILPVAASAPGCPPALVFAPVEVNANEDVRADLVLPTRHTALTVHVTDADGKAMEGVTVHLEPEAGIPAVVSPSSGAGPRFYNGFGSDSGPLHDLFALSGKTGPDGIARFVDMTPGLWDVAANTDGPWEAALTGGDAGVSVQAGVAASCALILAALPPGPTVRVLAPQGQPVPVQNVNINPATAPYSLDGLVRLGDGPAQDVSTLEHGLQPGLWRVGATYRDTPQAQPDWYNGDTEPFLRADAVVAVSHALPPPGLLVLHARRSGPGRLRVRLLGLDGRPAAGGTVVVPGFNGAIDYAATVDAHGVAVFSDVPSSVTGQIGGGYTVAGFLAGQPAPPDISGDVPPPPDSVLTAQTLIVPQQAAVLADTETAVVLRAQRAGYVRVHLRRTRGTEDYRLVDYAAVYDRQTVSVHRDEAAGTLLVGPLAPGRTTLTLYRPPPTGFTPEGSVTADVVGGHVTDTDLTPSDHDPLQLSRQPAVTPGQNTPPQGSPPGPRGSFVFLHDGTTPAWGAEAVVWQPPMLKLDQAARADALGRLQPGTLQVTPLGPMPYFGAPSPPPTGEGPDTPTLIVWMPGLTGAALVPYVKGQDPHVTLPAPDVLSGRVTIGRQSAVGQPGTIRVRAAYQGRGRLNDLLSRDVTAQPDGTFALPGLTAGTYLVQAARDGLWLSATQTVALSDDAGALPPLTLDIAPPGAPVVLHLAPGAVVALDRPAGPLTERLWPTTVRADGVGDLRLDGLGAGPHTARPAAGPPIAFIIPPVGSLPQKVSAALARSGRADSSAP